MGAGREARQDRLRLARKPDHSRRLPRPTISSSAAFAKLFKKQGLPIEIVVKDSQTNSNRAAEVAADLILKDKVSLMVVGAAPETDNPVADQCEVNEVPCVSTVSPWQPWFFARGGKPDKPFKWTYHYFWGLEDAIGIILDMWSQPQLKTNRSSAPYSPTIPTETPGETQSAACRQRWRKTGTGWFIRHTSKR